MSLRTMMSLRQKWSGWSQSLSFFSIFNYCLCSLPWLNSCLPTLLNVHFLHGAFSDFFICYIFFPLWPLSATLYIISMNKHSESLSIRVLASLEWNCFSSSFSSVSLALWRPTEWRWNQAVTSYLTARLELWEEKDNDAGSNHWAS